MDLKSALMAIAPAITPAAKPAPAAKPPVRLAKPRPQSARPRVHRIPPGILDQGKAERVTLYGSKEAHNESREPPQHDDVFPERHFGGPLSTSVAPYYPFIIHRTTK